MKAGTGWPDSHPISVDFAWVAAQVFDVDGDASEARPSQIINEPL
jgi:hypothetical protein